MSQYRNTNFIRFALFKAQYHLSFDTTLNQQWLSKKDFPFEHLLLFCGTASSRVYSFS